MQLGSQSLTACLGAKNSESVGLSQGEASFHAFHDLLGLKGCLTSRMKVTQSIRKARSWKSLAHPELLENHESCGTLLRVSGAGTSHGDRSSVLDSTPQKRFQIFFFSSCFYVSIYISSCSLRIDLPTVRWATVHQASQNSHLTTARDMLSCNGFGFFEPNEMRDPIESSTQICPKVGTHHLL